MPQIAIDKKKKTVTITLEYDESGTVSKKGKHEIVAKTDYYEKIEHDGEVYLLNVWLGRAV